MTDPAGPEHQAGDFRLQQKCFSKVFFLGLGERLEEAAAAFFFIYIENGTLILSFIALLSCIATLGDLLNFGLLYYKHCFFLFCGFILTEA